MMSEPLEPLTPVAGHLVNLFEAVMRAGGNPLLPSVVPPDVALGQAERHLLAGAIGTLLHGHLRGKAAVPALVREIAIFAAKVKRIKPEAKP